MIVHEKAPVMLVGGGDVAQGDLAAAQRHASKVVAADGGASHCLDHGIMPEAVIGDMDSIPEAVRARIPDAALHPIAEQDSTDFDKALRSISAPLVLGVGFTGARLDHELAAFNTLARHPARRCVLLGPRDVVFLCPPRIALDLSEGSRLSLFPMAAVEGISDGLRWPIAGVNFAPDGRVGTSNAVTGPVDIAVTAPKMLLILPVAALDAAVAALMAAPAWDADAAPPPRAALAGA